MEPLVNDSPLPAAQDSQPFGVAHTKPAQHVGWRGVLAKGLNPGTSKVACSGQSEEAAGQGWGEEKGRTTEGHRWDTGPLCTRRRQLRSEQTGHMCRQHHAGLTKTQAITDTLARTGEAGTGQGKDKGTGPRGPVMDAPGQQTPCLKGVKVCQTLMQN